MSKLAHKPARAEPGLAAAEFDIVLAPIAHPELNAIRIDDGLFAIGRNEAPFDAYPAPLVADLSRRQARIFIEFGAVYVADLGSKNGTQLNGQPVRQKPARLRDGDELSFGRELAFRVGLAARTGATKATARLVSVTLAPEQGDLGLDSIVITHFPFLVSKGDEVFACYKAAYPHQIAYLSRRHAHIFLKHGEPCIEDLGSTNGTFLCGKRLDEHALPLHDGDTVAFGGHHFVYRISLQREAVSEPTMTQLSALASGAQDVSAGSDKTTFVAAADSFLDIFCVDPASHEEDERNDEVAADVDSGGEGGATGASSRHPRWALLLFELRQALVDTHDPAAGRRTRRIRWGFALATVIAIAIVAGAFYGIGQPERELRQLLAEGAYAKAAQAAHRALLREPDSPEFQALGTEAVLKAQVPAWLAQVRAKDFDRAAATLVAMKQVGANNVYLAPMLDELDWVSRLERLSAGQGGNQAVTPAANPAVNDEAIDAFLKQWNADPQRHLRVLAAIAAQVPEFKDWYGAALSHLRKLQSDNAAHRTHQSMDAVVPAVKGEGGEQP